MYSWIEATRSGTEWKTPRRFVGQYPKPAFDQVEPRRRGRGEVEVEPGVFVQPLADVFVLVGGVVVQDQVDLQVRGHLPVDGLEEFQPFLMPVPRRALADDHAGQRVQRGEQGGGAVG